MVEPLRTSRRQPAPSDAKAPPIAENFIDDFETQFGAQAADAFPFERLDLSGKELSVEPPDCVHINLDQLKCYEVVNRQYEALGVTFTNAIALRPSNPAFPTQNGHTVLLGAPKSGWLEASFKRPVRYVSGCVTSSRRTVLSAFDESNQPVAHDESLGANLAKPNAENPPNHQVQIRSANISRVRFRSVGGELTVGKLSFAF